MSSAILVTIARRKSQFGNIPSMNEPLGNGLFRDGDVGRLTQKTLNPGVQIRTEDVLILTKQYDGHLVGYFIVIGEDDDACLLKQMAIHEPASPLP